MLPILFASKCLTLPSKLRSKRPTFRNNCSKSKFFASISKRRYSTLNENEYGNPNLLNQITQICKTDYSVNFQKTLFVCGQHLLSTTVNLFQAFIDLGAKPENICVVGKSYSTNPEVVTQLKEMSIYVQPTSEQLTLGGFNSAYNSDITAMWEHAFTHISHNSQSIENIIVLDDGGHVSGDMPVKIQKFCRPNESSSPRIVCIEQTSSGLETTQALPFPTIEVATSTIKNLLEPKKVAKKCAKEIIKNIQQLRAAYPEITIPAADQLVVGIAGLGKIGKAMLEEVLKYKAAGYCNFVIYDKNEEKRIICQKEFAQLPGVVIEPVETLSALFNAADIIIGATGTDITANSLECFRTKRTHTILVSCSSKDQEFRTLLNHIQTKSRSAQVEPLKNILFQNSFKASLILLRGGTPIGFTNESEPTSPQDAIFICASKLMACVQAKHMINVPTIQPENYMLLPEFQEVVLEQARCLPISTTEELPVLDRVSIEKNSGGISLSPNFLKQIISPQNSL